jgi:hypothetical protein
MSELSFRVEEVRPERYAAVPTLNFALQIESTSDALVDTIALHCGIRIEPQHRLYSHTEEVHLGELFGDTPRWGDTLKPFLWTSVSQMLPSFRGSALVPLAVPCTYDFDVAATKYLHSLNDGEIPLVLNFRGTVFTRSGSGFQVSQVPWNSEARFRMPVSVWREMMDLYYPNAGWLRLRRETLDKLMRLKATLAVPTWDDVVEALIEEAHPRGL